MAAFNVDDEPLREGAAIPSGGYVRPGADIRPLLATDFPMTRERVAALNGRLLGEVFGRPAYPPRPAPAFTVTVHTDEVREVGDFDFRLHAEVFRAEDAFLARQIDEAVSRWSEPRPGETLADTHDRLRRDLAALPEHPRFDFGGAFGATTITIPGDDQ